ncbi:MAG: hypothetical protein K1X28_04240 [Parachlamydiales bacterium]|nr:hypothetical protein [Parachlamydiales bacterium]
MSAQVTLPAPNTNPNQRVATLLDEVIDQKSANTQKALDGRVNINEAVMIGGDLFSMGYLAFQGAQIVKPALAAIPAIAIATLACGCIAGAINIGVAIISMKEGFQALKNGDTKLALRLFLDFFGLFGIGTIMILASLALRVAALSAVGTFFGANPWLLPVLFFIISIPILVEISNRIYNIQMGKDLASQLNGDLNQLIHGKDPNNPFHFQSLLESQETDLEVRNEIARRFEQLQADMGVEAASEALKLIRLQMLQEDTKEQLQKFKEKIAEWNRAQYVRMFQQVLYAAAFGVSMGTLNPSMNTAAVNGTQTFAMTAANAIPLYMDTFWPFKRNTPIVVPHVIETGKV